MTSPTSPGALYRETVLDHSRNPRNRRRIRSGARSAEGHNPLCGDRIVLDIRIEGDHIQDAAFEGSGCAISLASASMLTEMVRNQPVATARSMIGRAAEMFRGGSVEALGTLTALAGVRDYPSRVRCALLPWRTLEAALDDARAAVSTEQERQDVR